MARATAYTSDEAPDDRGLLDLYMVGLPLDTYRALSNAAAAQGLTFAQGLAKAIGDFVLAHGGHEGEGSDV